MTKTDCLRRIKSSSRILKEYLRETLDIKIKESFKLENLKRNPKNQFLKINLKSNNYDIILYNYTLTINNRKLYIEYDEIFVFCHDIECLLSPILEDKFDYKGVQND